MFDLEGRDGDTANLKRLPFLILNESEFEVFGCGGIGIKRLGGFDKPRVEQEPWQATKMVAVEMGNEHGIDVARLKPEPAHADKGSDAAIDQKGRGGRSHMK